LIAICKYAKLPESRDHLIEEVDVSGGELERLDLTQLVRRQGGYDLAQLGERVVE